MFIEFLIFGLCPWCECVGSIEWVAVWVVWMSATYSVSFVTANKPHWFLPLSLFTVTRLKTRPDPTVCDEVWTRLWQMEPLKHGSGPGASGSVLLSCLLRTQTRWPTVWTPGGSKTRYSEYSDHQKYKTHVSSRPLRVLVSLWHDRSVSNIRSKHPVNLQTSYFWEA